MARTQHTYAKRQREIAKRRKAEEKRERRQKKKDDDADPDDGIITLEDFESNTAEKGPELAEKEEATDDKQA